MAEEEKFRSIGSPIKDFVISFFGELEDGLNQKGLILCPESESYAKMELNAIATGETKAGGGAKILNIGGSIEGSKSNVGSQKITVYVKKVRRSDLAKENAANAEAEARIAKAQADKENEIRRIKGTSGGIENT